MFTQKVKDRPDKNKTLITLVQLQIVYRKRESFHWYNLYFSLNVYQYLVDCLFYVNLILLTDVHLMNAPLSQKLFQKTFDEWQQELKSESELYYMVLLPGCGIQNEAELVAGIGHVSAQIPGHVAAVEVESVNVVHLVLPLLSYYGFL